jgi:hypothetical protein
VTDREVTLGEIYDKMPAEDRKKAFFLLLGIAEFYASEETWFAVGLFPDPPSGDIVRDFRLAPDGQHRPGGRARLARSWIVSMFRRTLGTMKEVQTKEAPRKPMIFCNACGAEVEIDKSMGGNFLGYRVCSPRCVREARWRDTLLIMKKPYRQDPEPHAEKKSGE